VRPLVPTVATLLEVVIWGPGAAFTVTFEEPAADEPAWLVTVHLTTNVPELPEASAAETVIEFVPDPERIVGVTFALVPEKLHAYVMPAWTVTLAVKVFPAVMVAGALTIEMGAGTIVTIAVPVTFVPAVFVAEQLSVAEAPVPTEKVAFDVDAPSVIVPPVIVHETFVPLILGTLALRFVASAVAYCGALIAQLGGA
jgi:hypothetical protein